MQRKNIVKSACVLIIITLSLNKKKRKKWAGKTETWPNCLPPIKNLEVTYPDIKIGLKVIEKNIYILLYIFGKY